MSYAMSTIKVFGDGLSGMPWEDRPDGCASVVWRHSANPIVGWNPSPSCARVFNSGVVPWKGGYAGVFRADHRNGRAQLHAGFSKDGLAWDIQDEMIRWKDQEGVDFQPGYGYDPRVVFLEGKYYVIWCCDFSGASLGLGVTEDFKAFTRLENPSYPYNRNGVLFPRRVGGMYLMLSRPSDPAHTPFGDIFISESPDLVHWGRHRKVMSRGGSGWWQGTKIGAGAVPIETSEGWLLFYHGVSGTCNGYVYSFGAAILDKDKPSKVLYRTRDYLLTPEKSYEISGFVPNVVFPCATLCDAPSGRIAIYYGAADSCVAVAFAKADELFAYIKANSELVQGDEDEYRG
jgi:beta-1,4-mannooligosaccharide/beta-1,4-mannosyl-N-acetylglucosamine phosphorylase